MSKRNNSRTPQVASPVVGQTFLGYDERQKGWVRLRFSGGWEIHINTDAGIVIVHPDPIKDKAT